MHIFAVVNQKGGCGKTTTAINLAGVFASRGRRTLLVDLDPQGHCAAGLAIPEQRIDRTIGDAMLAPDDAPVDTDRLLWRVSRNLDLAPSTVRLATLEAARGELAARSEPEKRLSSVLARFKAQYDVCVIDCSPAIGMLTFNALVAANELLIPVETGFFALHGAMKQITTIKAVGKKLGLTPAYRLLATMHDPASVLARDLLEELKRRFPGRVIPVVIRQDSSLREAASFGQPVIEYSRDSSGAQDYADLAAWLSEESLGEAGAAARIAGRSAVAPASPQPQQLPDVRASSGSREAAPEIRVTQGIGELLAPTSESVAHPSTEERTRATNARSLAVALPASERDEPVMGVPSLGQLAEPKPTNIQRQAYSGPDGMAEPGEPATQDVMSHGTPKGYIRTSLSRAADVAARARRMHGLPAHEISSDGAVALERESAAPPEVSRSAPFGARPTPAGIEFVQPAGVGGKVALAGDFNEWQPERTPLTFNQRLGRFEALVPASPGANQYRLVIDGRWAADPFNPATIANPFGGLNSVVYVPPPGAWGDRSTGALNAPDGGGW